MRKALNENPMVQLGVVGVLLLVVGVFVMTGMGGGGGSESPAASDASSASVSVDVSTPDGSASTSADISAVPPAAAPAAPVPDASDLTAGPGLPREVIAAYRADRTIVLLIVRGGGIEDRAVRSEVAALSSDPRLAVFITRASGIARYSRITQGVGVDRVPALVVIRPRRISGGVPEAEVAYGFRDADGVRQAVRDAVYDGPQRDYHPG